MGKEGVGFAPKSKNKKKNDKAKRPPPLKQTFVKEGEGASNENKNNVKGGDVKKGNATPSNKAGDFNPYYVLCRASDGHVYAKLVGSSYEYIESNKAGDFNPYYVLCRASDGHVYAKLVGSSYEYIEWSTWVPKTLVTNIKGPITKWVPKTKL